MIPITLTSGLMFQDQRSERTSGGAVQAQRLPSAVLKCGHDHDEANEALRHVLAEVLHRRASLTQR